MVEEIALGLREVSVQITAIGYCNSSAESTRCSASAGAGAGAKQLSIAVDRPPRSMETGRTYRGNSSWHASVSSSQNSMHSSRFISPWPITFAMR